MKHAIKSTSFFTGNNASNPPFGAPSKLSWKHEGSASISLTMWIMPLARCSGKQAPPSWPSRQPQNTQPVPILRREQSPRACQALPSMLVLRKAWPPSNPLCSLRSKDGVCPPEVRLLSRPHGHQKQNNQKRPLSTSTLTICTVCFCDAHYTSIVSFLNVC